MSQGWSKIFNRINWLNRPSTNTPLNATNLNAGDSAIDKLDDRIITLDTVKADMQVVNGMVADVSLNSNTGVITVTYKNGSHVDYDTNLEKIAVNFSYDYSTQRLVLTLSDGSKQYVDMSALITQYEFKDSTTIAFSVDSTGKISASVKNGSITDAMLETGYLANITAQATKAESMANSATTSSNSAYDNAKLSQSYAIGGSGIREGEDTDNAMYYYEQAKKTDIGQIRSEVAELNSNLDGLGYGERCAYNILKPTLQTTTKNGLTCTQNLGADGKPDGTYTINGTSSKQTIFYIVNSKGIELNINNNAKFIGCPSGGSSSTYSLTLYDEKNNKWYDDYGNGRNISDTSKITMYIQIYSGVTVSNLIFKPMITLDTTATYDDYKPYIPSVKMLADEVSVQNESLYQLKNDLSEQFHNRSYSGTLSECVSSVAKAIANGQSTTFNFIRENDSYYFGFVGRFTEDLIGGLMTNSSGAVYKIGGSVESPTTTQM